MSRFSVVPASYVYLRRGNSVLLQLRQNTGYMDGYWAAGAAGHIELGETAVQAAQRELEEELGVTTARAALQHSVVMQRTQRGTTDPSEHRIDWFFSCGAWEGEPVMMEPQKCAELRWFALDRLPEKVADYERVALQRIAKHSEFGVLEYGFEG